MTLDVWTRRLKTKMNALLEVRDAAGRLVADGADTAGNGDDLEMAEMGFVLRRHGISSFCLTATASLAAPHLFSVPYFVLPGNHFVSYYRHCGLPSERYVAADPQHAPIETPLKMSAGPHPTAVQRR